MTPPCSIPQQITLDPSSVADEGPLGAPALLCDASHPEAPDHWARQWNGADSSFRTSAENQELYLVLYSLRGYLSGSTDHFSDAARTRLGRWVETASGDNARPLDRAVLGNLRRALVRVEGEGRERAEALLEMIGLPPPEVQPEVSETEPSAETESSQAGSALLRSVGIDLQNDSLLLDGILGNLGIPINAFVTEQSHLTLRVPFELNFANHIFSIRAQGGVFTTRGIPGSGVGETGLGWRAGIDVGLTNPQDPRHQSAGLGFELTGVAASAGDEAGVENPDPTLRLHFYRQSDLLNFTLDDARQFEVGLQTFLNYQETYFNIVNDQFLPEPSATPFSSTQSLWTLNPFRMLGLSLRYYPNGVPQTDADRSPTDPFRPGEAAPRIASVAVGNLINRNRRRGIPTYTNSRVFLGTFEPLGSASSRDQFDTVGLGLSIFSALDGYGIFNNVRDRSEIWRRGNWLERGVSLAIDGVDLLADILLTATAAGDPPPDITPEEFRDNPGSVTDFEGRAGRMDLFLHLFEYALTGLDATEGLGEDFAEGSLFYNLSGGMALALAIPFYFFSAPMTGSECGPAGGLLYCGFGTSGPFFRAEPYAAGPGDIHQMEAQYMVSSMGIALGSWGASRLLNGLGSLFSGNDSTPPSEDSESSEAGGDSAQIRPNLQLQLSPERIHLQVGGTF